MRIRRAFRIINWSAAGIAAVVIVVGKDGYYPWIVAAVLAAVSLHFLIDTFFLVRRLRYRHRLADTREFRANQLLAVKDLEAALSAGSEVAGVTLPVIVSGTASTPAEKAAPLSGKKALAWRLVAEPLEGLGKVGGQVILVDSWWPALSVKDETGTVALKGPGVLDGSSLVERVFSMATLGSDLPQLASRVADGLGIPGGKESKGTRIALREVALLPHDKVTVYGTAQRSSEGLVIGGTDVLDDPGSLLVRAASRPASSRMPRRIAATVGLAVFSLALLAGLVGFITSTIASSLFAPGGLFDSTRTGPVNLDLDGRPLRVTIAASHWAIDSGDTTKGYGLSGDSAPFKASRTAVLLVQLVRPEVSVIANGDAAYPRWDGAAWVFEASSAGGSPAAATDGSHAGRLYIRNLTGSPVTIRVLKADNSPAVDTSWTFDAYEAANDPRGHYLNISGSGPQEVSSSERLELTTGRGYVRILPVVPTGRWDASAWRIDLVPELLAGRGNLYVKNSGDLPVRIWLIGADGRPLFGDDPWSFEPREGSTENKGLKLTYNDKNIAMSGREVIKTETQQLTTLYEGPLERVASWKGGSWRIDMSRLTSH